MPEAALSRADLKRGRALLWLILAAALSAAVAVVAVLGDRAAVTATSMNETMFPGFAESSAKAATIQLSVPVITSLAAVLLLGESITLRLVASSAAILGGIALVVLAKRRAGSGFR